MIILGVRPRSCLAEAVAQSQFFLVTTTILQKFKLTPSFQESKPSHLNGILKISYDPLPYKISVKKRN